MELTIRHIQEEDNPAIAIVIRSVLEEYGVNKPGTVYTDPTTDKLYELFKQPKSRYWVIECNQEILGGGGIFPTKGLVPNCIELVKLYLSKEARGVGLGKMLMQKCIDEATSLGYAQLYLESLPELDSAIGLYEKLGFTSLEVPLGESGHFACDIWMVKDL
ncbi:MAG: GNAT family N-acetyltransferase [Crocinitomicaceae bacterium]|nr:GNAT family N-acetyltransferase [Crocinitomicaceae bacterium]